MEQFGESTTIFSWNINGLNAVLSKGKLIEFINSFSPDVVCLNETKTDYQKIGSSFSQKIPDEYE